MKIKNEKKNMGDRTYVQTAIADIRYEKKKFVYFYF